MIWGEAYMNRSGLQLHLPTSKLLTWLATLGVVGGIVIGATQTTEETNPREDAVDATPPQPRQTLHAAQPTAAIIAVSALVAAAVLGLALGLCAQAKASEPQRSAPPRALPPAAQAPTADVEQGPGLRTAAGIAAVPADAPNRVPSDAAGDGRAVSVAGGDQHVGDPFLGGSTDAAVEPGQPANYITMSREEAAGVKGSTGGSSVSKDSVKAGVAYESDDEGVAAEARLQQLTESVKGHSRIGSARRLVDEGAAIKAVADQLAVPSPPSPQPQPQQPQAGSPEPHQGPPYHDQPSLGVPTQAAPPYYAGTANVLQAGGAAAPARPSEAAAPAPEPRPQLAGGPVAAAAAAAAGSGLATAIDLDIDLAKGELKVDYSQRGLLGQGGFAAVYKGRYRGQRVAVKMIKKATGSSLADLQEDIHALMHELNILRQVNHPNIVALYGGCLRPPHIFLVEERMEGTLDFYLHSARKADPLSVREIVYFSLDIACGLAYLHPRIVHRDLKPANVLLSREGRCKISDFGLARTKLKEYLSTKNLDAGTTSYIAPECFMSMDNPDLADLRRSVTDKTDIYALGIMMWEMLAGKRPWQGLKPLLVAYQVAYRSLRPPVFELGPRCVAPLRQLVEDCWAQEPQRRPSSRQVVDRLLAILQHLPQEEPLAPQQPGPGPGGVQPPTAEAPGAAAAAPPPGQGQPCAGGAAVAASQVLLVQQRPLQPQPQPQPQQPQPGGSAAQPWAQP